MFMLGYFQVEWAVTRVHFGQLWGSGLLLGCTGAIQVVAHTGWVVTEARVGAVHRIGVCSQLDTRPEARSLATSCRALLPPQGNV